MLYRNKFSNVHWLLSHKVNCISRIMDKTDTQIQKQRQLTLCTYMTQLVGATGEFSFQKYRGINHMFLSITYCHNTSSITTHNYLFYTNKYFCFSLTSFWVLLGSAELDSRLQDRIKACSVSLTLCPKLKGQQLPGPVLFVVIEEGQKGQATPYKCLSSLLLC